MKKQTLTIAYLADASSIHTRRWVNYFAKRGHAVHLLSFAKPTSGLDASVHLHILKNRIPISVRNFTYFLNLIPNIFQIKKTLEAIRPDLLHAHEAVNYGRFAVLAQFHPLIITPWGTDIFIKSAFRLQRPITKFTLRRADLITCDGKNTRQEMMKKFGISPEKITLIRFGIDTKKFRRMPKDEKLKKKLNITDEKVVISLRSLARSHGVATLIEAIPRIVKDIPRVKFLIAGDPSYDPEYMEKIKKLVSSLRIKDAVIFLGHVSNEKLPSYLNLADLYISTALSDSGLSSSTAEAMACELPVILSDSGDNNQWVQNGKGGFIVPCEDHRALAVKIIETLKTESAREIYGAMNRKAIEEKNDYDKEMAKMEKLYYDIAA